MSAPNNFLSVFAETVTLPAGVATPVDIPVSGAGDWCFAIKNTGPTNAVTALTVERFPLGTDEIGDGPTAVATNIPLAPGAATAVNGTREPIATLRLTLTSVSGTVVRIAGGGR